VNHIRPGRAQGGMCSNCVVRALGACIFMQVYQDAGSLMAIHPDAGSGPRRYSSLMWLYVEEDGNTADKYAGPIGLE
jgi:hypothetical protein